MTENQANDLIISMIKNDEHHFLYYGTYFGYPGCCVFNFSRHDKARANNQYSLYGTGFIPCDHCYKDKSIEQLIGEIDKNRLCPTTFPKEPTEYKTIEDATKQDIDYILYKFKERLLPLDYNLFV